MIIDPDVESAETMLREIHAYFGSKSARWIKSLDGLCVNDLEALDLAVCDFGLDDGRGVEALSALLDMRDDLPVVMASDSHEANEAMEAIRVGAADYVVKYDGFERAIPVVIEKNIAIARVRRDNLRLQAALSNSLAELKRKNRELEETSAKFEQLASTDLLTDLANRRRLEERLDVLFSEAVRYDGELSCLMIDLDGFKAINDYLGHQRGDELLRMTGRLIMSQVRSSDLAARYGGDEFVVVLPRTGFETAMVLAERLSTQFGQECVRLIGQNALCGMSIGVASRRLSSPVDAHQMIAHADVALYAAKLSGRSRVMVCSADGVTAMAPEAFTV